MFLVEADVTFLGTVTSNFYLKKSLECYKKLSHDLYFGGYRPTTMGQLCQSRQRQLKKYSFHGTLEDVLNLVPSSPMPAF